MRSLQSQAFACVVLVVCSPVTLLAGAPAISTSPGSFDTGAPTLFPSPSAPADADGRAGSDEPISACACGCGIFDVGTSTMLPRGKGGMAWFEYDYSNQNMNRKGGSRAPAADNDDQSIRTDFFQFGVQYFFDRRWGVQLEIPFDHRSFKSVDDGGNVATTTWTALGDIRVKGIYTGLSEGQSIGLEFGLKLPTGEYRHPGADRDTQIGTGSSDVLVGGYYRTNIGSIQNWDAFAQFEADLPVLIRDHYRPGYEFNVAGGVYYSGIRLGRAKVVPIGQLLFSARTSDGGDNSAHPVASGYQRVLLSPGLEIDLHPLMIYGDVEVPVYQYVKGNQLTAPVLFKLIIGFNF